jgi:tetratricopeptide (TPR) repeat protein
MPPLSQQPFLTGENTAWRYVLVAALAVLPYVLMPANPLIYDSSLAITANQSLQSGPLMDLFSRVDFWGVPLDADYSTRSYRPLVSLTYALQVRLFGGIPWLFHLGDMILHALAALLVVRLVEAIDGGAGPALIAGAVFAVHPVQTDAVCGVVGRADIMAGICLLGALVAHLTAPRRHRPWLWEIGALVLLAAGFLCKEYAVSFPFVLIAVDLILPGSNGQIRRRRWIAWGMAILLLAAYLSIRYVLMGAVGGVPMLSEIEHPLHGTSFVERWPTVGRLVLLGARLLVLPIGLNHHYRYGTLPIPETLLDPGAFAGITLIALLLLAGIVCRVRYRSSLPLIALALVAFPLGPSLNTVSLAGVLFAERFLYIPVAGLALIFAWIIKPALRRAVARRVVAVVIAVILVVMMGATMLRVRDWSSPERLARSSLRWYPNGSEVWMQLGLALAHQGRYEEAVEGFERSIEIQPKYAPTWKNYAATLSLMGRHEDAVHAWRRTVELAPRESGILFGGLGEAEIRAGNVEEAVAALGRAHELMPADPAALMSLGRALLGAGRLEQAVEVLRSGREGLRETPAELTGMLGQALVRLARTRLDEGRHDESVSLAREAVDLDMLPPAGLYLAGLIAFNASEEELAKRWFERAMEGDPELLRRRHQGAVDLQAEERHAEAAELFGEILAARPDHVPTLFNRGRALLLAGRPEEAIGPLRKGLALKEDPGARALLARALREAGRPGGGGRDGN